MGKRDKKPVVNGPVSTGVLVSKEIEQDTARKHQVVHSVVVKRTMMYYPLNEPEFEGISRINTELTFLIAFGPSLFFTGLALLLTLFTLNLKSQPTAFGVYAGIGSAFMIMAIAICFYMRKVYKEKAALVNKLRNAAVETIPQG